MGQDILLSISKEHDFNNYSNLLAKASESTISMTREYTNFIATHLDAEPYFLAFKEDDRMLGAIPFVLKKNARFGNIINSNPYFGSYGGLLVNPDLVPLQKHRVKLKLAEFLHTFAKEHDCILSMIDASPFDRDQTFYSKHMKFDYMDRRIAQIMLLPTKDLRQSLFVDRFSSSCRRAIRKAEKAGVTINEIFEKSKELDDFYEIYKGNMLAKDGALRAKWFFEKAFEILPKGSASLQYATLDEKLIAGIFVLYYKDTIQYTQPAIDHKYRESGATNLLVYEGMQRGGTKGYAFYNFGGTWEKQDTVYNFKRSFGAADFPYYYFITSYGDISGITKLSPKEIEEEYPGFYVIPFSQLQSH